MALVVLSGFRVYICFNYYAGNGRDGNIFRRVIVSVFSRMNQIRFDDRGARVPAAHRRPLHVAREPHAGRIDSRSFGTLAWLRTSRSVVRQWKSGSRPAGAAGRFSSLKHPFILPSGKAPRAGFVRLIAVLLRDAQ
ncbi:hypothetical protein [Burkholderia sp. BCC1999]|uniref:hypothetical protein n=1 Tax=Burkholderia sp. BCC1999 TaxID=2817448 RepID=UPI002AC325CE|nr:hypothetical protein [Burkholderia sp. BCC1999]